MRAGVLPLNILEPPALGGASRLTVLCVDNDHATGELLALPGGLGALQGRTLVTDRVSASGRNTRMVSADPGRSA